MAVVIAIKCMFADSRHMLAPAENANFETKTIVFSFVKIKKMNFLFAQFMCEENMSNSQR